MSKKEKNSKNNQDKTPMHYFFACSISYCIAMLASNSALKYVSYPTQVLKK